MPNDEAANEIIWTDGDVMESCDELLEHLWVTGELEGPDAQGIYTFHGGLFTKVALEAHLKRSVAEVRHQYDLYDLLKRVHPGNYGSPGECDACNKNGEDASYRQNCVFHDVCRDINACLDGRPWKGRGRVEDTWIGGPATDPAVSAPSSPLASQVVHADIVVEKVGDNLWKMGIAEHRADGTSDCRSADYDSEAIIYGLVAIADAGARKMAELRKQARECYEAAKCLGEAIIKKDEALKAVAASHCGFDEHGQIYTMSIDNAKAVVAAISITPTSLHQQAENARVGRAVLGLLERRNDPRYVQGLGEPSIKLRELAEELDLVELARTIEREIAGESD